MPVEILINPGNNPNQEPYEVIPGGYAIFTDFTGGEEHKLGVKCPEDDSGVEFYCAKTTDLPEMPLRLRKKGASTLFQERFKQEDETLGKNGQTERTITERNGKTTYFVIKHALKRG